MVEPKQWTAQPEPSPLDASSITLPTQRHVVVQDTLRHEQQPSVDHDSEVQSIIEQRMREIMERQREIESL